MLFSPCLVGVPDCGLGGILRRTLVRLDTEPGLSSRCTRRIFVTGGGSLIPGFIPRLQHEITSVAPFKQTINVYHAQQPRIDSWRGAQQWNNT